MLLLLPTAGHIEGTTGGHIGDFSNKYFVPTADAGYLSVQVIQQFFVKNLHFYACAGNTPCR